MTIDEIIETACIGDRLLISYAPTVIASTLPGPGVYVYQGTRRLPMTDPEIYLTEVGSDEAHRITATWMSRGVIQFQILPEGATLGQVSP